MQLLKKSSLPQVAKLLKELPCLKCGATPSPSEEELQLYVEHLADAGNAHAQYLQFLRAAKHCQQGHRLAWWVVFTSLVWA